MLYEFGQLVFYAHMDGHAAIRTFKDVNIFSGIVVDMKSFNTGRGSVQYTIGHPEKTGNGDLFIQKVSFYEDSYGHGETREKAIQSLANEWFDYAEKNTEVANSILSLINETDEPPSEL